MKSDDRKPDLMLIAVAVIVMIVVFGYSVFDSPKFNAIETVLLTSSTSAVQVTEETVININTASAEELTQLKFIGEKKAQLIVEYRELNGKFRSVDELKSISGITQNIIDANKGKITV